MSLIGNIRTKFRSLTSPDLSLTLFKTWIFHTSTFVKFHQICSLSLNLNHFDPSSTQQVSSAPPLAAPQATLPLPSRPSHTHSVQPSYYYTNDTNTQSSSPTTTFAKLIPTIISRKMRSFLKSAMTLLLCSIIFFYHLLKISPLSEIQLTVYQVIVRSYWQVCHRRARLALGCKCNIAKERCSKEIRFSYL